MGWIASAPAVNPTASANRLARDLCAPTLPGRYWPLAHAEHVAVGVLEPRTASRTDLGDEVDCLRRLVFLEGHAAGGELGDDGLDVNDLEMCDCLADVRLSTPDRQLLPFAGTEPNAKRGFVEERQANLFVIEPLGPVEVRHRDGRHGQRSGEHRYHSNLSRART